MCDGTERTLERRKVFALLAYLAVNRRPYGRDELAELLFPRLPRSRSRSCLRQTLSVLKSTVGEERLQIDRGSISMPDQPDLWVDLHEFLALAQESRGTDGAKPGEDAENTLDKAAKLWRGEFLSGFYLRDSPAFDDWQTGEQDRLRAECAFVLERLTTMRSARGDFASAIAYARTWLSLDPLEEAVHRRLMQLSAAAGRRAEALRQYRQCAALLRKELGECPDEETESLREHIEAGQAPSEETVGPAHSGPAPLQRATPVTLENRLCDFLCALPASLRDQLMNLSDAETRLVTVVCVEVPGSPDTDVADLLLKCLIDVLSRYDGRIESVHADEVLAVFGAPQVHEDDPVRAVLAALELRGKAREHGLDAAAGISTGHARFGIGEAVELDVPGGSGQPTASDSLTTIARQLRGEAGPGEILVGESTHRYLFGSFPASPRALGTRWADGSATAYLIEGRDPGVVTTHRIERQQTEFVGRAREYALLEGAFSRVMGGAGQVVSIIGEAGVGKTRLVAELRKRTLSESAAAGPPRWLEGHCLELAATAAYWPFIDMLGRHFKLAPHQNEEAHAQLVTEELQRLRRRGSLAAERLEEIAPLLGRLLSIRYGTTWDLRLAHAQPEQVRHQTFLAIRDVLLALAGERPLILVLEDLQWADSISLDVISLLMESVTIAPFMLVCVRRPEADHGSRHLPALASRKCPDRYTEIGLHELTPEESRHLIHALLSVDALPRDARDAILAQCQGNPFFVEEVVRSLIDTGLVYRDGDRWRAREGATTAVVPETVQSVILSRVDRLESRLREVLESASVIGRIFQREILERAVEAEQATEEALAELEARALIHPNRPGPQGEYSFRHVLTQQAVYQSILQRRRAGLHERIAEAMEGLYTSSLDDCCVELAHHYVMAGNRERAAEYLLMAGEKAAAAHMNEEALGHLRGALELLGPDDAPQGRHRIRVLTEMGKVLEVKGEHSLAEGRFREAAEMGRRLGVPPGERAQVLYLLCKSLTARHRPQEYVPIASEALALVGKGSESPEALMLEFVTAYSSFDLRGDFTALCDYAALRGQRIRSLPYSLDNTINATYLAWAYLIAKNEPAAMGWLEWAEAQARGHNDLVCLAAIHVRKGRDMLARCGDGDGAAEAVQEAAGLYRMTGARYLEVRCHLCLGDIHYRFGRLEEAEVSSARVGELCAELRHDAHLAAEHELLKGQVALARGDAEKAIAHFKAALAASPGRQWECFLRFLTARTLVAQGRREDAARCLQELLQEAREFRLPPAYFLTVGPAHILSLLEDCFEEPEAFRAAYGNLRRSRADDCASPAQWCLDPAQPVPNGAPVAREDFSVSPGGEWVWENVQKGCDHRLENGLVVSAAIGRGLEGANLSAPRLLRNATGDVAIQVACEGTGRGRPATGGLMIWKDQENYLRLDQGVVARGHVAFGGCIRNRDVIVGCGRLGSDRSFLRLERSGACVRALASTANERWHTVGRVEFPAEDPLRVGLFADGAIRPEVYLHLDREGSEIRFTKFELASLRSGGLGEATEGGTP